jgi:hypothetical protein
VCDGVSEGNFPNPEVTEMVAQILEETNDPGAAARAVCHKAVEMNSKDNISCMVVLFDGLEGGNGVRQCGVAGTDVEYNPGPLGPGFDNSGFLTAYAAMADRAHLTLAQAVELRYELLAAQSDEDGISPEEDAELTKFGDPKGAKGSTERATWFEELAEEMESSSGSGEGGGGGGGGQAAALQQLMGQAGAAGGPGGAGNAQMMQMLMGMMREQQGGGGPKGGEPDDGRRVLVSDLGSLQASVDAHPALKWDERMERCGCALAYMHLLLRIHAPTTTLLHAKRMFLAHLAHHTFSAPFCS